VENAIRPRHAEPPAPTTEATAPREAGEPIMAIVSPVPPRWRSFAFDKQLFIRSWRELETGQVVQAVDLVVRRDARSDRAHFDIMIWELILEP
jgi:hypothetical protein